MRNLLGLLKVCYDEIIAKTYYCDILKCARVHHEEGTQFRSETSVEGRNPYIFWHSSFY
jgi:hypothetical protein